MFTGLLSLFHWNAYRINVSFLLKSLLDQCMFFVSEMFTGLVFVFIEMFTGLRSYFCTGMFTRLT